VEINELRVLVPIGTGILWLGMTVWVGCSSGSSYLKGDDETDMKRGGFEGSQEEGTRGAEVGNQIRRGKG